MASLLDEIARGMKRAAFEVIADELAGWLENEEDTIRSYGASYVPFSGWDCSDVSEDDAEMVAEMAGDFNLANLDHETLLSGTATDEEKIIAAAHAADALDLGVMENLRDDEINLDPEERLRLRRYEEACKLLGLR